MSMIRKNITLSEEVYKIINDYAKQSGKTFSEFLRDSALGVVKQKTEASLLEYITSNCSYVDLEEQKEIDELQIDYDTFDGVEISLDEIL